MAIWWDLCPSLEVQASADRITDSATGPANVAAKAQNLAKVKWYARTTLAVSMKALPRDAALSHQLAFNFSASASSSARFSR